MHFEFDPGKSVSNQRKHGIDFVEAQKLWEDPNAVVIPARTVDEVRFALLGGIRGKVWIAFYTHRHEHIRLTSVRRTRPNEREIYESKRPR